MKAFPFTYELSEMQGMDLRDYFAAHAPEIPSHFPKKEWSEDVVQTSYKNGQKFYLQSTIKKQEDWLDHQVRWSYVWADAMMKAREQ